VSSVSEVAPSRYTRPFHDRKEIYGENAINHAIEEGRITTVDAGLLRDFVVELRATRGISLGRANKIIYTLLSWRHFIGEYRGDSLQDIYRGISRLNDARIGTKPYKQNTRRDFITFLKRFYRWLISRGLSAIRVDEINAIRAPRRDTMTKTAEHLLSEDQIRAMIEACQNSRDRALLAVMYDGGFRLEEMGTLSWGQVKFDEYGAVINVNEKTQYPRYVRITASAQFLAAWMNDYPLKISRDALVFITRAHQPLEYNGIAKQFKVIARRAGITKHITPHLLRHSRITHMIQRGYNESIVKKVMWGNLNTTMFSTYVHLTNSDIDHEILSKQGIVEEKVKDSKAMEPKQCVNCRTINPPTHAFCSRCGQPLSQEVAISMEKIQQEIEETDEFKMVMRLIEEKLSSKGRAFS